LQTSYSRQKRYYDKHSRPDTYHEGDLVQIYKPIPPPGTLREFYHPWSKDPFRVVKILSPTNYLVRNAGFRTQPITVHHNKMRPYKGSPLVGYEDEVYGIVEERKLPDGITKTMDESGTGDGAQKRRRLYDNSGVYMRFVGERREHNIHVVADEPASSLEPETQPP
ncbi:hypothetical protein TSMEX_010074, partial [Taenia solium]